MVEQYANQCKDLINPLLIVDDFINDREQALYMLRGLEANYNSLMTNITNKKFVLGLDEFFTKMKTYEHQL